MRCFAVVRPDHSSSNCSSRGCTSSSTGRDRSRFLSPDYELFTSELLRLGEVGVHGVPYPHVHGKGLVLAQCEQTMQSAILTAIPLHAISCRVASA